MKYSQIRNLLGFCIGAVLTTGCAGLKVPYPAKSYYLVDPGAAVIPSTTHTPSPAVNGTLKVRQIRIASPFNGDSFIYKVGPNQYASDYYDAFLMPTDRMLTSGLTCWLGESGLFTHVVDAESSVRAGYALEGSVSKFMIDATDPHKHQAVVDAQFFLLHNTEAGPEILFSKSYTISAPVKSDGHAAEVEAWNEACQSILVGLTSDINQKLTREE
jgi:ABC-type uncharacterized transport system auxiliary subunit